jgi:UDP-N-acetylmuramate dehydrogenase
MGEFVESVTAMDFDGEVRKFSKDELVFGCRSSNLSGYMVLEALLKFGKMGRDPQALAKVCGNFLKIKRSKQVLDAPSAGCVFKNSAGSQFTSGQLIDMLGLKGRRAGGAEISPKHANFIVNRGGATFRDVMGLIELIRTEVRRNYGINLELEVKIV